MPKKRRTSAAKKGWATRRQNQRKAQRENRQREKQHAAEQRKIERLLGEEFDSLREARAALKAESTPIQPETADQWDNDYEDYGQYEDQGEFESALDT
jgi:hypothetical protein